MKEIKELGISLRNLQAKTIGLVKVYGCVELVVDECDQTITTIHVGNLGGLSQGHFSKTSFPFKRFPDNKTLAEFMNEPIQFDDWYSKHFGINQQR